MVYLGPLLVLICLPKHPPTCSPLLTPKHPPTCPPLLTPWEHGLVSLLKGTVDYRILHRECLANPVSLLKGTVDYRVLHLQSQFPCLKELYIACVGCEKHLCTFVHPGEIVQCLRPSCPQLGAQFCFQNYSSPSFTLKEVVWAMAQIDYSRRVSQCNSLSRC